MSLAIGDCSSTATILLHIIDTNSYRLPQVDVVQLLRLRPDLAQSVRIVKNGKSQVRGTWLPYQVRFDMIISITSTHFQFPASFQLVLALLLRSCINPVQSYHILLMS